MPLEVLALLVVVSLTLVIATVHFTGGRRKGTLTPDEVRAIWLRETHKPAPQTVVVSANPTAAFLLVDRALIGLVLQMGAHHVVREVARGSVANVTTRGNGVAIGLRETTLPHVNVVIEDDVERAMVVKALNALTETDNA